MHFIAFSRTEKPHPDPGKESISSMQKVNFITLAIAFEGSLIIVALALGWLAGVNPFASVTLERDAVVWGIAATVPPLLVVNLAEKFEVDAVTRLVRWLESNLLPRLRGASLTQIAMLSLLAGIGEEALFRGVIQVALSDAFTPAVGLVLASVIFGLAHYVNLTYAVYAALFGLYLGWLMIATDNLLAPIVVHSLYDFFALDVLMRSETQANG